jgi:hypothetical protein
VRHKEHSIIKLNITCIVMTVAATPAPAPAATIAASIAKVTATNSRSGSIASTASLYDDVRASLRASALAH